MKTKKDKSNLDDDSRLNQNKKFIHYNKELIKNNICRIDEAICCRDDIMVYLESCNMEKKIAFDIMERVRKGKHLTKEHEERMRSLGIPEWYIVSCNKIAYMFPKAHAAAYVTHALRLGYFKIYHPLEYYTVYFSIKSDGFDMRIKVVKCRDSDKNCIVCGEEKIINERNIENYDYDMFIAGK